MRSNSAGGWPFFLSCLLVFLTSYGVHGEEFDTRDPWGNTTWAPTQAPNATMVPTPTPTLLPALENSTLATTDDFTTWSEFWSSLGMYLAGAAVLLGLYEVAHRMSCTKAIYRVRTDDSYLADFPRCRSQRPPPPSRYLFGWIAVAAKMSDEEVHRLVGLDGLLVVRVARLGFRICASAGFFGMLIMAPVFATGNLTETGPARLTLANVEKDSPRLWVTVLFSWAATFHVMGLLREEYARMSELRSVYLAKGDPYREEPQKNHTVVVQQMPVQIRSGKVLEAFMEQLFPGDIYCALVVKPVPELRALVARRDAALRKVTNVYRRRTATGKEQQVRVWGGGEGGLFGEKHDAISHWDWVLFECNIALRDRIQMYEEQDRLVQRSQYAAWARRQSTTRESLLEDVLPILVDDDQERHIRNQMWRERQGPFMQFVERLRREGANEDAAHRRVTAEVQKKRRKHQTRSRRGGMYTASHGDGGESKYESDDASEDEDSASDWDSPRAWRSPTFQRFPHPPDTTADFKSGTGLQRGALPLPLPIAPAQRHSDSLCMHEDEEQKNLRLIEQRNDEAVVGTSSIYEQRRSFFSFLCTNPRKVIRRTMKFLVVGLVEAAEVAANELRLLFIGERASLGFVTFRHKASQGVALQCQLTERPGIFRLSDAPGRADIIWRNITRSRREGRHREFLVSSLLVLGAVFWSVLVGYVIDARNNLILNSSTLQSWVTENAFAHAIFVDLFPSLLLLILIASLGPLLLVVALFYEGVPTHSEVQARIFPRLIGYHVCNTFVIVSATSIADHLSEVWGDGAISFFEILGNNIPHVSVYATQLVLAKTCFALAVELFKPHLLFILIVRRCCEQSADARARMYQPVFAFHAIIFASCLFVLLLALIYLAMSPLVPVAGALFFTAAEVVYKHNLLYMYLPRFETGGQAWTSLFWTIVTGSIMGNLVVIGYLSIQGSYAALAAVCPLPCISVFLAIKYTRLYHEPTSRLARSKAIREDYLQELSLQSNSPSSGFADGEAVHMLSEVAMQDITSSFTRDYYANPLTKAVWAEPDLDLRRAPGKGSKKEADASLIRSPCGA
jgi:hypothetical protein